MFLGHTTLRNTPSSTVGGEPTLAHGETGHGAHNSADAVHMFGDEVTPRRSGHRRAPPKMMSNGPMTESTDTRPGMPRSAAATVGTCPAVTSIST